MPAVTTTYRTDKDGILCRVVGQLVRGRAILRGAIPEWEGAEREREREGGGEREREREIAILTIIQNMSVQVIMT